METLESNKLIAEFMEYKEGFPHETDKHGYHQCVEGFNIPDILNQESHDEDLDSHQFTIHQLKFHTSWDWLMPVVEKIEGMGFKAVIMKNSCSIYNSQYNVNPFEAKTKLQAIYNHVVDFIKYYNEEK